MSNSASLEDHALVREAALVEIEHISALPIKATIKLSSAISLKRIADALEKIEAHLRSRK